MVILDLAGLSYADSSTLGVLVTMRRACRDRGGAFCLAGVPQFLSTVLETTRLETIFDQFGSVEAALSQLSDRH